MLRDSHEKNSPNQQVKQPRIHGVRDVKVKEETTAKSKWQCGNGEILELSESFKCPIVILKEKGLSLNHIMARLKVSQVSLHGMLKCFAETGLIMSNHSHAQQKRPHQQKINTQSFVH